MNCCKSISLLTKTEKMASRKRLFLPLFLLVLLSTGGPLPLAAQTPKPTALEQTLRESRGQKRLLLVLAASAEQPDFKAQKAWLARRQAELTERDVRVLDVLYASLTPADRQCLIRQIGGPLPAFAAVLIGKDGGVKRNSPRPIAPADLFETVDKMPMRRQEMRQRAAAPEPGRR